MTRRESRECAVKLTFELGFDVTRDAEEIVSNAAERDGEAPSGFARELFAAVCGNLGDIDGKIALASENWKFERIGRVPLAVLRVAAAELYFFPKIPIEITVNEALEIAKKYDDEKAAPFVNGVLGKLTAGLVKPEAPAHAESKG